jgi:hypothetical protein
VNHSDIAERFQRETASHEMTVLHDDGLYRHLRFARPKSSLYLFEIVTWPGSLAIRGDLNDSYVFTRLTDMFEFFRSERGEINPDYWAEKTAGGRDACKTYSEDSFNQHVSEVLAEVEKDWPGVTQAWKEHVSPDRGEYNTEHEDEARDALNRFAFDDFQFYDTWEWDLRDFDWSFLWACHAIVWGIRQYDARKVAAVQGGESR